MIGGLAISHLSRRRRGSIGFEAILALPAILLMGGVITQAMLPSQNRIYVEQAAFAAARSALVLKCKDKDFIDFAMYPAKELTARECDNATQDKRILNAARWALVPAAPSSDFAMNRKKCAVPEAGVQIMGVGGHPWANTSLTTAVRNRICYAFETGNVTVTTKWRKDLMNQAVRLMSGDLSMIGKYPVEATVTFRAPLTTPIQRLLSEDTRDDKTRWRSMTATVVLQ